MEQELYGLIKQKFKEGEQILVEDIRNLALNLSRYSDFKASKGWVTSFAERFQLTAIYTIV